MPGLTPHPLPSVILLVLPLFFLLHLCVSPVTCSTLLSPSLTAPSPYLGLWVNPSIPTQCQNITVRWLCFYCDQLGPTASVTLTVNRTVLTSSAPLNSSLTYTVACSLLNTSSLVFTARVPSSSPTLQAVSTVHLRPLSPSFTPLSPVANSYISQSKGLYLDWQCSECYFLHTLTVQWSTYGSPWFQLVSGVPLDDKGLTVPIVDEMAVSPSSTFLHFSVDHSDLTVDVPVVIGKRAEKE